MNPFFRKLAFISGIVLLVFPGCKKDNFTTDTGAKLGFSQDTIMFDTVFTSVGSATKVFSVYNNNSQAIRITSIRLATGSSSQFRLNVDGVPGKSFTDVEIGANDSMFIFVEVTVDPNNLNSPLIVTDSILFETNGNLQDIKLVAWGQDAYFHHAPANSPPLFFINCGETWANDKPHVVYGFALVDSGCVFTISAGTNVFFHPNSGIIVLSSATMLVNGTLPNPVTLQGDRLGQDFQDVPGQWDQIWFSNLTHSRLVNGTNETGPGSKNSVINFAIIKNGNIGLHVDTVFAPGDTTLRIENTIVKNMASNCLAGLGSWINAFNCVFANSGSQNLNILYGGNYNFYHCTFANFWNNGNRQDPMIFMNNYYNSPRFLNAYFGNCIVFGNQETEIGLDSLTQAGPGWFNFKFDHALLKVGNSFGTSNPINYSSIIRNSDPFFKDIDNNDYELDSTSIAVDAGDPVIVSVNPILNFDLKGNVRPQGNPVPVPDLGAYERR